MPFRKHFLVLDQRCPDCGTTERRDSGDSNTATMNEQIRIIIGNASFTATLEDNATAKAFKASLPITVNMTEHAGNEKFYYLPTALPTSTVTPGTILRWRPDAMGQQLSRLVL